MNAPVAIDDPASRDIDAYREVRERMVALSRGLSAEDLSAQSMADASPGKWHLAHTSWFFEAMILAEEPGYQPVDDRFQRLFNSYYDALGTRVGRHERSMMTRPDVDQVLAYRQEIDRRMEDRLKRGLTGAHERYLFTLGLHHDQQHQELFLMDMLNLMSRSPLDPAAYDVEPRTREADGPRGGVEVFDGGVVTIGHDTGFAFDNEGPAHRVWLEPFALDRDLVTNGQWIRFIENGGYLRPELWLADGMAAVRAEGWTAPLYWHQDADGGWTTMGLGGRRPVDRDAPVRHVSFYEADAFARWSQARLPTEAEWEHAARERGQAFGNLFGEVWQHTACAYVAYPGFKPTLGTASEYNGKFMANQTVLRGSCFATPTGHERVTYRNFFYPNQRWAFCGLRLARDPMAFDSAPETDTAAFAEAMHEGLSRPQKTVSPKWFYDAEGSRLFEEITRLPEYYPTRQEAGLLKRLVPAYTELFGDNAVLVEFGSGASEKTRILLDGIPGIRAYMPIDISAEALAEAAERVSAAYPELQVVPHRGDFLDLPVLPELGRGRRIGFFPGSTIGNLDETDAVAFLRQARARLGPGSGLVLGADLAKDPAILIAAYDDAQGVTARFNKNLLVRANRELGADFNLAGFDHQAVWNGGESRMEMHLRASRDMTIRVDGRGYDFVVGETIHTECSRKYTQDSLRSLAEAAGWTFARFDVSEDPAVSLSVLVAP